MDDHLTLTSSTSDVPHLEGHHHEFNMPLEFTQQAVLAGPEGNMNFSSVAQATEKDPIERWYHMNDGPWHPPGLTSGTDDGRDQSMVSGMRVNTFGVPSRPSMVPSEFMGQSDSGYGSYRHRPSVTNGSVCDDTFETNPDTQSIMGGSLMDASFPISDTMPKNSVGMDTSWPPQIPIEPTIMKCDKCHKAVKTKSELKKHNQRHTKPFKCDVEDCPRRLEGFSTTNDLDRHKRSVHPTSQAGGNRYICPLGTCKNKSKIWPRADNFKAHLKRVHMKEDVSDEELEGYVHKQTCLPDQSQDSSRQDAAPDYDEYTNLSNGQQNNWPPSFSLSQNTDSTGNSNRGQRGESLSLSHSQQDLSGMDVSRATPRQGSYQETARPGSASHIVTSPSPSVRHDQLSHGVEISELLLAQEQGTFDRRGHVTESHGASTDEPGSDVPDGSSNHLRLSNESPPTKSQGHSLADHVVKMDGRATDLKPENCSVPNGTSIKLDLNDPVMVRKLIDTLQSHGLLEQLGYKKEDAESAEVAKVESEAVPNQNHCHRCSTCGKGFPRRCELKKHEKRHEKPYGCTMPDCDKKFGSKNDWKRHENTQHFMLEMWRCDEQKAGNVPEPCEKVCYRREIFRVHLEKDHHTTDQHTLDAKLEKCRVGRNCEARFWCGFCQEIVEIKQKGLQAWAERFDHIDEHFSGRNRAQKEISEWKNFDQSQPSRESPKEDPDDVSDCCSSSRTARAQYSTREGRSGSLNNSKTKRKRDNSNNAGNSKKAKTLGNQSFRGYLCVRQRKSDPAITS
ncbi:hypothetical protein F5Y19DRAFT_260295 [Xylariaceae sp. FL1651]|nr:hypothetical protein F5Y19DRAFT_260295 [Xylariaceae sp. FL1651]